MQKVLHPWRYFRSPQLCFKRIEASSIAKTTIAEIPSGEEKANLKRPSQWKRRKAKAEDY